MSCSMVSGGKLFLALTPDPIWSLTPLNSLAARVYPSRVAVMLMWITWPCARLQWSRALPQSLSPIRDVIIGEDAAAQHHYSELRHYLAGNIRMFTITRCPDSTPTTPIKGSTKKLVFLGPRGPLVLPLIGQPISVQELLLALLLLLLSRHPWSPWCPPPPRHPGCCCCCCWSSGGADLLQMIIWRGRPFANDHPEESASCK